MTSRNFQFSLKFFSVVQMCSKSLIHLFGPLIKVWNKKDKIGFISHLSLRALLYQKNLLNLYFSQYHILKKLIDLICRVFFFSRAVLRALVKKLLFFCKTQKYNIAVLIRIFKCHKICKIGSSELKIPIWRILSFTIFVQENTYLLWNNKFFRKFSNWCKIFFRRTNVFKVIDSLIWVLNEDLKSKTQNWIEILLLVEGAFLTHSRKNSKRNWKNFKCKNDQQKFSIFSKIFFPSYKCVQSHWFTYLGPS